jgi:hypothetical protein
MKEALLHLDNAINVLRRTKRVVSPNIRALMWEGVR